jgi:hypothetical protein
VLKSTRVADEVLKNYAPVQWLVKKYRDKVVAGKQDGGMKQLHYHALKLRYNSMKVVN